MAAEIRLARGTDDVAAAYQVRHEVFVTEQGVPADLELDAYDEQADHFLAYGPAFPAEGTPAARDELVGAGRLVVEPAGFTGVDPALGEVGHLGRLAVRRAARGSGLGVALVGAIEARARDRGLRVIVLSAQTQAIGFYERLGYTAYGEQFDDAGLPHRWMSKVLN